MAKKMKAIKSYKGRFVSNQFNNWKSKHCKLNLYAKKHQPKIPIDNPVITRQ